ncbi:hypothetical protein BGP_4011 [Beggiatoa sp. PS]|nr:hypothetical protein BGP_4011 [Beggiatoa sp. PS]
MGISSYFGKFLEELPMICWDTDATLAIIQAKKWAKPRTSFLELTHLHLFISTLEDALKHHIASILLRLPF